MSHYEIALRRLYSLGPGRMLPGRERLKNLLKLCDLRYPSSAPVVLVGGTNGKGSLVAALSAALTGGLTCGAFIKPHLKTIRERWRIEDQPVSEELFAESAHAACDMIDAAGGPISFFEANVLLGRIAFQLCGCAVEVWEVGLGGTHDACNALSPVISVITNVQLDHQAVLGDTFEQIAADKAGIARQGMPLLLGPPRSGWESAHAVYAPVVRRKAEEAGALLLDVSPAPEGVFPALARDSAGLLAAVLAELDKLNSLPAQFDAVRGLASMHYRGRMEQARLLGAEVLLDAAHNADSMRWLARQLGGEKCHVIFGCQNTKDPQAMLAEIAGVTATLTPIAIPVLHPLPVAGIAAAAAALGLTVSLPAFDAPGSEQAPTADIAIGTTTELDPPDNSTGWIESVLHGLSLGRASGKRVVICGSIYYLGEILRAFEDGWVSQTTGSAAENGRSPGRSG